MQNLHPFEAQNTDADQVATTVKLGDRSTIKEDDLVRGANLLD